MKVVALVVFVVGLALMTGCSGMTCPMCKKSCVAPEMRSNQGPYQLILDPQGAPPYRFNTQTGEAWWFWRQKNQWEKIQ